MEDLRLKERRERALLTQEELAGRVGVSVSSVKRWEAGQRPQPAYLRQLLHVLDAALRELRVGVSPRNSSVDGDVASSLTAPRSDADDHPDVDDVEEATWRLRRSYSTAPPAELLTSTEHRLTQVRELIGDHPASSARATLLESSAWLTLLRGTLLADLRQFEAAQTSIRASRGLAGEIGHREIEAWGWETAAWIAVVFKRYAEAHELAGAGIEVAPEGGYGLAAALGQRARINGLVKDADSARRDLDGVDRALALAGPPTFPDDHFSIDEGKGRYFGSGAMSAAGLPRDAIVYAREVIAMNDDPKTRNFWPMRVSNVRLEWALALADLGEEDEAVDVAGRAIDPEWWRPDTAWRLRMVLARMRDPQLRSQLMDTVHRRITGLVG